MINDIYLLKFRQNILKAPKKSLVLFFVTLFLASCVTERKVDEAHGTRLFFQNLNSKYNGFFNASVLMDEATDKLRAQHVDNYAKVLDVYPELAVENPKSVSGELDKAIEKIAVVATYHRSSDWTDDCYLLLGKAQYYKHEFESAQETFEYMSEVYDPNAKRRPLTAADRKANAAAAAAERKLTQKEKLKEKERVAKEKEKALELKEKAKENALKEKEKLLEAKRKQRERDIKERADARKRGIKLPPKPKLDESGVKPTTKDMTKTGTNGTPVYKQDVENERKRIDSKSGGPKSYFLKHRPCFQESLVWLARVYTERGNYVDADFTLAKLEKSAKTFKDIRAMTAIARANLYLKQKNSDGAIAAIENALTLKNKPRTKARLYFILGQLYSARANTEKANIAFDKVLDHNPVYEMAFNAQLNKALTSSATEQASKNALLDMSTDFKNKEYNDQVYFALGQLALKNKKRDEAIDYFRKTLSAQGKNPQIKTDAYYTLANYEYESGQYATAKLYYDSTLTIMQKSDERYTSVSRLSQNLVEIARNYNIVQLQDSLLRISALTEKEQRDWAKKLLKKQRDAAEAIANAKAAADRNSKSNATIEQQNGIIKSSFFGYDADLVKRGRKEFEKKWGNDRKLEDNWRRSNKKANLAGGSNDVNKATDTEKAADFSESDYKTFLKDIPKTKEDIAAANVKVEEAMFQLGTLYHDKLQNDKMAAITLENHLSRFADTKHKVEDYYYLYSANQGLGETATAQKYFDKIVKEFPESNYAKILTQGAPEIKKGERTIEIYYDATYALFQKKDFAAAKEKIRASSQVLGVNNYYKPKFELLNAMCDGRLQGKDAYIAGLKNVIAQFPGTEEEKRAKEIMRILDSSVPVTENPKDVKKDSASTVDDLVVKFKNDPSKLHYVIVVMPKDADLEKVKVSVSDFNARFNRLDDLKISSVYLSTETEIPVIVVRKFKDRTTALAYTKNTEDVKSDYAPNVKREVFAVTQDNYREILRQKSIDAYRIFYQNNY